MIKYVDFDPFIHGQTASLTLIYKLAHSGTWSAHVATVLTSNLKHCLAVPLRIVGCVKWFGDCAISLHPCQLYSGVC